MTEYLTATKQMMCLDYGDGFSSVITGETSDGPMTVIMTGPDGRSWRGTADGITAILWKARQILTEQRAVLAA